jgi:predicted acetyltransferase
LSQQPVIDPSELLALREPSMDFADDFRGMVADYRAANEEFDRANSLLTADPDRYIKAAKEIADGLGLLPGMVPQTSFWLIRGGDTIVAASWLRHRLTPALGIEGGHIGYTVRPPYRRQGFGTHICALTLDRARRIGIRRALITCDTDNSASARIIQKNGGVFSGESRSPRTRKLVSRYWVDLE